MTLETAILLLPVSLALLVLAWLGNVIALEGTRRRAAPAAEHAAEVTVAAGAGRSTLRETIDLTQPATPAAREARTGAQRFASGCAILALLTLTAYIGIRWSITGHGPFTNQHEFAVAFVWAIVAVYLYFEWRHSMRVLSLVVLAVAAALLLYGMNLDSSVRPLMPALQNNPMLTIHVGTAMLSYGAACVSFGAAVLYLISPRLPKRGLPSAESLDEISYRAAAVTFPVLTIMIIVGAIWAETAWGRYWGWDPKETAALVTWLIWGAYLHARVSRGWRGRRAAWLVVAGFAAVLFAYFGNHFLGGLHSYA